MIYLFLGEPSPTKEQDILRWRDQLAPLENRAFDYETLDGYKIDSSGFKQSLIALPVLSKKRVVLIRNAQQLSVEQQNLLGEFAGADSSTDALLDWNGSSAKVFLKKFAGSVTLLQQEEKKPETVFDMTKLIARQPAEALKKLYQLFQDGQPPLQVMGVLIWYWKSQRNRVSAATYAKGLLVLQEADARIKRTRLKPQHAVEIAMTKLSLLITS
jgi:DNA polymerase III delta subunit